jgi:hypothetical protein
MTVDLSAATSFIHSTARLLDRLRFAYLLEGAGAEPVLQVLRAYRNPDGGFGHAIEPDMRAPVSQPVGVQTAMEILHEIGVHDDPMITPAGDWLASVTRDDGGIPFCLPSAADYPRSPIWRPADASSLIQTAANAAAMHALGVRHPWLDDASEFCWRRIDAFDLSGPTSDPGLGYEVRFGIAFLDAVPDAARAEAALDALAPALRSSGLVAEPGSGGDVQTPLDLSPWPGSRSRHLFDDDAIERDLDALAAGQRDDGGWTFGWPDWSPVATHEWRGVLTLHSLRVLRANGRL